MASATNSPSSLSARARRARRAVCPLHLAAVGLLVLASACASETPAVPDRGSTAAPDAGPRDKPGRARPRATVDHLASPAAQLALAYHRRWVSGELRQARRGLQALLGRGDASDALRAKAALWLAEIAELRGQKRAALEQLEAAKRLAGPATALARIADDRRARIVSSAPLADVRGPAPGSVRLRETPQINALFRRAEQRLVAFHRVVVRPRIENIDSVRRGKQAALSRAVALYEQVERLGSPTAKAAARFRVAAMYHHMAEALAFERPPELLQKFARKLTRQLQAQSVAYLSRALSSYRAVAQVKGGGGSGGSSSAIEGARWKRLAKREAQTLARLLGSKNKGKGKGKR
jgi:hypothetical protein